MRELLHPAKHVRGRVRVYAAHTPPFAWRQPKEKLRPDWHPEFWAALTDWHENEIMYDWATIAGQLLTSGSTAFKIGAMYIEYQNVSNPDDAISPPAFDRTGGIDYYNSLADSPNTDYLRVPLIAAMLNSSDTTLFPGGNSMYFFAQTQGVVGMNGKPFSDVNNSKVYGGALIASPDFADQTQDLVFSRYYLPTGEQQVKLATLQYGMNWNIVLG